MTDCIHVRATGRTCTACEETFEKRLDRLEFTIKHIRQTIAYHPGQPDEHHDARPVTQKQYDELRDDLQTMTNLVYSWKRTADHYKTKLQEQMQMALDHKCSEAPKRPEGRTRKAKPKKRSRSSRSEPKTLPCGCDGPICIDDEENYK